METIYNVKRQDHSYQSQIWYSISEAFDTVKEVAVESPLESKTSGSVYCMQGCLIIAQASVIRPWLGVAALSAEHGVLSFLSCRKNGMIPNLPYELAFTKSAPVQYTRTRLSNGDRHTRGPKALSLDEENICQKFSNGADFSPIIVVCIFWPHPHARISEVLNVWVLWFKCWP